MVINLQIIKDNINNIRKLKEEYDFLKGYDEDKLSKSNLINVGIYEVLQLLDFDKSLRQFNVSLNKKMKYTELSKILSSSSNNDYTKKRRANFIKIFKSYTLFLRYFKRKEFSNNEPLILTWLAQNEIDIDPIILQNLNYRKLIVDEINLSKNIQELQNSDIILKKLLETIANQNQVDITKCNLNYLSNLLKENVRRIMDIPRGSQIVCNTNELYGFTIDKKYSVLSSNLTFDGYIEVLVKNDNDVSVWTNYSFFTEITKFRDDKLSQLGLL